jgi:transposase-like protein
MNFFEFNKKFPTEQACVEYFIKTRYKDGIKCNHCGSQKYVYRATHNKKCFVCHACKNGFSIFAGTIFEKSSTDLRKWMYAIHLFLNGKKGISALQLKREIGVTYKTAWRMLKKIREAMGNDDDDMSGLKGIVECDEVYLGGRAENKHMNARIKAKGIFEKMCVFGMIERGGDVKALRVNDAKANTLISEINKSIQQGSIVMTDEHKGYNSISGFKYNHRTVNHSVSEYVKDGFVNTREGGFKKFKVHTNTIEGFWATLKRGIKGNFHHISKKYLQDYVNEFAYRYNNRENNNLFEGLLNRMVLVK